MDYFPMNHKTDLRTSVSYVCLILIGSEKEIQVVIREIGVREKKHDLNDICSRKIFMFYVQLQLQSNSHHGESNLIHILFLTVHQKKEFYDWNII